METIKSSSTFIEQNPHNFSCNAITYMDRNHMQTFNNFTFQPKMQIPYDINNFGKWDKLGHIYLDKTTIKIKCCNLFRCLQILCLAPSTKMLPQKPLLHKCKVVVWIECTTKCMSMAMMGNQWHVVANTSGNTILHYFMKHPPHERSLRKKTYIL
jgi:hypothetical protein